MVAVLLFALIALLVAGVAAIIVRLVFNALGLSQPWFNIALAIILLIWLVLVLQRAGVV